MFGIYWSFELIRFRWKKFLVLVLCDLFCFSAVPIVTGELLRLFFDALAEGSNVEETEVTAMTILFVTALIYIVRSMFLVYRFVLCQILSFSFQGVIREKLLENCFIRSGFYDGVGSKRNKLSVYRDDVQIFSEFVIMTANAISDFTFVCIALAIMFRENAILTIFVAVPVLLVGIAVNCGRRAIQKHEEGLREKASEIVFMLGEVFSNILGVKASRSEGIVISRLGNLFREKLVADLRSRTVSMSMLGAGRLASDFGVGIFLLLSASYITSGSFSVGQFSMFIFLLGQIGGIGTNIDIGTLIVAYRRAEVSAYRIRNELNAGIKSSSKFFDHELSEVSEEIEESSKSPHADFKFSSLKIENLVYQFVDEKKVSAPHNFVLEKGTFTVITGYAGSGKSSLLRAIYGDLRIYSGLIRWNDKIVSSPRSFFVPPICSICLQLPTIFNLTIRENILLGQEPDTGNFREALRYSVLDKDVQRFENGLDTLAGNKGSRLSGGQIRRIALARAFLRRSELYILDDPTCGLDHDTIMSFLSDLPRADGSTYLVASSDPMVIKYADRVISLPR